MQIKYLVRSQKRHKVMQNQTWHICANAKSTGLKFCRNDVLQGPHIVIVISKFLAQDNDFPAF